MNINDHGPRDGALERIIEWSAENRLLVGLVTLMVAGLGAWAALTTPVASGPSAGWAPSGSRSWIWERYSSTRLRAQYRSVPSSKMT